MLLSDFTVGRIYDHASGIIMKFLFTKPLNMFFVFLLMCYLIYIYIDMVLDISALSGSQGMDF